ncbi:hypothetical protein HPB51_027553 [Rhipicephalus microplus]|uniref:Uncharacterized protein n=1 Tax=Rhipicephalus microplus TaxID=6941 RepID=A0A9J6CZY4_RHIMP|nr:hypothetical protein HPB51_027553 [Rhipicephalus microplus]
MEDESSKTPGDTDEDNKDSGWITVTKRRSQVRKASRAAGAGTPAPKTNAQEPTPGRHSFGDAKKNLIRGSKMPPLPWEETKVVVRPRGGLCISKSGTSVVAEAIWSAAGLGPEERNTDKMCPNRLQNIMVSGAGEALGPASFRERSPSINVDGFLELNECHQQGQPGPSTPGGRFKSREIQNQRQLQESFHVHIASRIPFEIRGLLYVQDTVSIQGWHQTTSQLWCPFRIGLGPGQEKTDAPSTKPDPSPRTDCGHARGLPAVRGSPRHQGPEQGPLKPNLGRQGS